MLVCMFGLLTAVAQMPVLSNAEQLKILLAVKSGKMTQDEAIALAFKRQREEEKAAEVYSSQTTFADPCRPLGMLAKRCRSSMTS